MRWFGYMIHRFDKLATELPEPAALDANAAAAVQELMGGKFGEMSTVMNYTFQSFNFRARTKFRPFYESGDEHRRGGIQPHRTRRRRDQPFAHRNNYACQS